MVSTSHDAVTLEEARMSFLEHLQELRVRLLHCIAAVIVCMIACFSFADDIYAWLQIPLADALESNDFPRSMAYTSPVEPFIISLKVALLAGLFAALPYILFQFWRFISPGLYPRERRAVIPFVFFGTVFFVGGALFCRYVVLPLGLEVLLAVAPSNPGDAFQAAPVITLEKYFSFAVMMMIGFGIVFELPVVVLFLSWIGLITYKTLIRHWRGAIVAAFVLGALLTPPDPGTQLMLAAPLVVLYAFSILVAFIFGGRPGPEEEAFESEE